MTDRADHIVLLTGHLALRRVETAMQSLKAPAFTWSVMDVGVKVAALMTGDIIRRRVSLPTGTTKVVVPGRCRADLDMLAKHFAVPFERGPDEAVDIPQHFGGKSRTGRLDQHDLRIFAEIVEAPESSIEAVLKRAAAHKAAGADVIDIGGLPDTPFPHLGELVQELKRQGYLVSIDSADMAEIEKGVRAGADFILSLNENTLNRGVGLPATPVIVPATPGDLPSLIRACERMEKLGLPYIADPILDPIHFGFTESIVRYHQFRKEMPQSEMLMGTGNLTELTEADTTGITAMLTGICSELSIRNVLIVQVSPHTRRTVQEHDAARRMMHAAKSDGGLPKGYSQSLLGLHDRKPFANTPEGIADMANKVRDANFRIEVVEDGIHVYNRDLHDVHKKAFDFFPRLGVESDGGHAFYLGAELMKAEIALALGKRYAQDNPLDWGISADRDDEDLTRLQDAGHTLKGKERTR
jgi:dihydropteroate synthase-like protein